MVSFLDDKDSGNVITTHIQLLLGCAIPVWLSYRSINLFLPLVGIISVGVGDAVAAVYGSMFGCSASYSDLIHSKGNKTASAYVHTLRRALLVSPCLWRCRWLFTGWFVPLQFIPS
jgi:hypothetical protein